MESPLSFYIKTKKTYFLFIEEINIQDFLKNDQIT